MIYFATADQKMSWIRRGIANGLAFLRRGAGYFTRWGVDLITGRIEEQEEPPDHIDDAPNREDTPPGFDEIPEFDLREEINLAAQDVEVIGRVRRQGLRDDPEGMQAFLEGSYIINRRTPIENFAQLIGTIGAGLERFASDFEAQGGVHILISGH